MANGRSGRSGSQEEVGAIPQGNLPPPPATTVPWGGVHTAQVSQECEVEGDDGGERETEDDHPLAGPDLLHHAARLELWHRQGCADGGSHARGKLVGAHQFGAISAGGQYVGGPHRAGRRRAPADGSSNGHEGSQGNRAIAQCAACGSRGEGRDAFASRRRSVFPHGPVPLHGSYAGATRCITHASCGGRGPQIWQGEKVMLAAVKSVRHVVHRQRVRRSVARR